MWRWDQESGHLWAAGLADVVYYAGYSGFGPGKNTPAMEAVHDVGPIPRGLWNITELVAHHPTLGEYVLLLEPCPGTETFGRTVFRIHGDSAAHPGQASHGCIVLPRAVREMIWNSGDHLIEVLVC